MNLFTFALLFVLIVVIVMNVQGEAAIRESEEDHRRFMEEHDAGEE